MKNRRSKSADSYFSILALALVAGRRRSARELLVNQIPFVDDDDDRLAILDRFAGDGFVLLGDAFDGVEHEEDHIGPLNCIERTQARKIFDRRRELRRGLDARGVDEPEGIHLAVAALEIEREFD